MKIYLASTVPCESKKIFPIEKRLLSYYSITMALFESDKVFYAMAKENSLSTKKGGLTNEN